MQPLPSTRPASSPARLAPRARAAGIALAACVAAVASLVALWPPLRQAGLGALALAIGLGMLAGNTPWCARALPAVQPGLDWCASTLLRLGVVLYGFRVSFQDIAVVGWQGVLIAVCMVALVFGAAMWLGPRWLGLDRQTCALIGAGSAICGAAAVLATQPVVRGTSRDTSVAVATVVAFGTLAMVAYPLAHPLSGLSGQALGVYVGSTVHEVAQVVAVGEAIGPEVARIAVIEKMLRVMLLAPFLVALSWRFAQGAGALPPLRQMPWFAVLFIVAAGVHSLGIVPPPATAALVALDGFILCVAMAAIGSKTRLAAVLQAGLRPHLLAALLFALLVVGGYLVNRGVPWLLQRV